jgi:hypothetical protein
MSDTSSDPLANDILWGVKGDDGIARFLGIDPRKCYYLIGRGKIPVTKIGAKTITASRSKLRKIFTADA